MGREWISGLRVRWKQETPENVTLRGRAEDRGGLDCGNRAADRNWTVYLEEGAQDLLIDQRWGVMGTGSSMKPTFLLWAAEMLVSKLLIYWDEEDWSKQLEAGSVGEASGPPKRSIQDLSQVWKGCSVSGLGYQGSRWMSSLMLKPKTRGSSMASQQVGDRRGGCAVDGYGGRLARGMGGSKGRSRIQEKSVFSGR